MPLGELRWSIMLGWCVAPRTCAWSTRCDGETCVCGGPGLGKDGACVACVANVDIGGVAVVTNARGRTAAPPVLPWRSPGTRVAAAAAAAIGLAGACRKA